MHGDAWLRRIKRDRSLPRNAFSVTDEIARGFNRKYFRESGALIASIPTLAAGTGLSRSTIMRMVKALDAAGDFAIFEYPLQPFASRYASRMRASTTV